MCVIEFRKAQECVLELPLCRRCRLNPVCRYSKITVSVTGLPCITCQTYFTENSCALRQTQDENGKTRGTEGRTLNRSLKVVMCFMNAALI